jgi:hypothetical protein
VAKSKTNRPFNVKTFLSERGGRQDYCDVSKSEGVLAGGTRACTFLALAPRTASSG